MANLTIRGVPDSLYLGLKRYARGQGRSLNAQVIQMLRAELQQMRRLERMRGVSVELERFVASVPPAEDSTLSIRKDRDRSL